MLSKKIGVLGLLLSILISPVGSVVSFAQDTNVNNWGK